MSDHDGETQRTLVQRKLRALVDCVMAQADKDPAFAEKLAQILLSHETSEQSKNKASNKLADEAFNPVLFLKEHGEALLLRQLETQTDDDLRAVLRFQGLRRGKELKKLARKDMLGEIVNGAKAKLRQGLVVAQLGTPEVREQQPLGQSPPAHSPVQKDKTLMPFSDGTRKVLQHLISRWSEASASEKDPAEHKAFAEPIELLRSALERPDATHNDIRRVVQVCPAYPNFGKQTLIDLADAERDGRTVHVVECADGALKWELQPVK